MEEELLREELTNINLCINEIISVGQGYEFLDMLLIDRIKVKDKLTAIEEEKWKRIFGEEV